MHFLPHRLNPSRQRVARKNRWCLGLALVLLALMGGGQSAAVIQLYAWGSMIVRYAQEDGIVEGVRDTFSGERPCEWCRVAQTIEVSEASLPRTYQIFPSLLLPILGRQEAVVARQRPQRPGRLAPQPRAANPASSLQQTPTKRPPVLKRTAVRAPPGA